MRIRFIFGVVVLTASVAGGWLYWIASQATMPPPVPQPKVSPLAVDLTALAAYYGEYQDKEIIVEGQVQLGFGEGAFMPFSWSGDAMCLALPRESMDELGVRLFTWPSSTANATLQGRFTGGARASFGPRSCRLQLKITKVLRVEESRVYPVT